MLANDQQRRFSLDDRGYIIDKANPEDGKKYKYHGEPNPSDKDVRGYILRRRLKHLVRKLIVGSKAEQVRRSLVAMLLAAIEASQLNILDPSLSMDHPFKGKLHKKKGMRDYTSISLFIRDVERLLRELYGDLDSEGLEELLQAIRFIVVEFATHVSPDLGQECSYAADYECTNGLRSFAEKALTIRVVEVSSNPEAHGCYTKRFVKALAKYWLDDLVLDLDLGEWDLSRKIRRHKVKNRRPYKYPTCICCGKGDLGPHTLQVVQAGGEEPIWTHGQCYADVHAEDATKSLEEAKKLLRKANFNSRGARGAVKCLKSAMQELRSAKDCLVGKACWPNLCVDPPQ